MATANNVKPMVNHFLSEGYFASNHFPSQANKKTVTAIWNPIPDNAKNRFVRFRFFLSFSAMIL